MIDEPERQKAQAWIAGTVAASLLAGTATLALGWPAETLLAGGFSIDWLRATRDYLVCDPATGTVPGGLFRHATEWLPFLFERWIRQPFAPGGSGLPGLPVLAACAAAGAAAAWLDSKRPYELRRKALGGARWATRRDLVRDQLFCPTGIVLGQFGNRFVRNYETASALLIAPPRTGKTAGMIIANLLADWPDTFRLPDGTVQPGPSLVVNDPKGELEKKTRGWRSRLGPTFVLDWAAATGDSWNPLSLRSLPGGDRMIAVRRRVEARLGGLYTSPANVVNEILRELRDNAQGWREAVARRPDSIGRLTAPAAAAEAALDDALLDDVAALADLYGKLELYIDRINVILIPDTVELHWRITGRQALAGMILFTIFEAIRLGHEPSFGRLIDWLTQGVLEQPGLEAGFRDLPVARGGPDRSEPTGETPLPDGLLEPPGLERGGEQNDDMIAQLLKAAIETARTYGYPSRVASDLTATLMKPDRERGSVISTAGGAINIFGNAVVRARTSSSSFAIADLRGMAEGPVDKRRVPHWIRPEHGRGYPVTVYCRISLENAASLGRITALLVESIAAYAISQDEEEIRRQRPIGIVADEFWTWPRMEVVPQIPALGGGQWVWFILCGQSFAQLAKAQGDKEMQILLDAINYNCYLTQNSHDSAEKISKSIGNYTATQQSRSRTEGIGKGVNPFQANVNTQLSSLPLIRPDELQSMPKLDPPKQQKGRMLIQIVGAKNRPIDARPAAWFWHPMTRGRAKLPVVPHEAPAAANANGRARGRPGAASAPAGGADRFDEQAAAAAGGTASAARAMARPAGRAGGDRGEGMAA